MNIFKVQKSNIGIKMLIRIMIFKKRKTRKKKKDSRKQLMRKLISGTATLSFLGASASWDNCLRRKEHYE